jgi:hypothetical protein
MRPIWLLLNGNFTFLNAEFNNKQIMKCTYLKMLMLLPHTGRLDIKQFINSDFDII